MSASICLRNGLIIVSCVKVGNIPEKSVTQATVTIAAAIDQRTASLTTTSEKSRRTDQSNHRVSGLVQQEIDNLNDVKKTVDRPKVEWWNKEIVRRIKRGGSIRGA
jgi:hypothetical protein